MGIVIGIDVGGSTTKIVGFERESGKLIPPIFVRATDPVTSMYGAFGRFLSENELALSDVSKVMMTGVGSSFVKRDLYGLECRRVDEFGSIGLGGLYLSGMREAVVVSLGTGTALVHAKRGGEMKYLGGTGVGGGTLMGLSKLLMKAETVEHIGEYAAEGNLGNVDLRIKDITASNALSALSRDLTASNFGNLSDMATKSDLALGVLNLVFETVGMVSIFAARSVGVTDIVLTGNVSQLPHCRTKFDEFNSLKANYGVDFLIPERARFATVIGTALRGLDGEPGGVK